MRSVYIVSDVHGCYDTLMSLIEKLPKDSELIFCGDLVDRGPNSRKTINFVRDNNHKCVLGNHEDMMIDAYEASVEYNAPIFMSNWYDNGGKETFSEYEDVNSMKEDIEWMKGLDAFILFGDVKDKMGRSLLVTHAPSLDYFEEYRMQATRELKNTYLEELIIWNRNVPKKDQAEMFNVFGHNPVDWFSTKYKPEDLEKYLTKDKIIVDVLKGYAAIDTGACYYKSSTRAILTALEFPSMKVYQQENIEQIKNETTKMCSSVVQQLNKRECK